MNIEEVYAIWGGTEFKDKDMKKSFERMVTSQAAIELIKKIRSLEQAKVQPLLEVLLSASLQHSKGSTGSSNKLTSEGTV